MVHFSVEHMKNGTYIPAHFHWNACIWYLLPDHSVLLRGSFHILYVPFFMCFMENETKICVHFWSAIIPMIFFLVPRCTIKGQLICVTPPLLFLINWRKIIYKYFWKLCHVSCHFLGINHVDIVHRIHDCIRWTRQSIEYVSLHQSVS